MQNEKSNNKLILGGFIVAGFALIVAIMLISYVLMMNGLYVSPIFSLLYKYHFELMLIVSILGVFVGATVYFLLRENIEIKTYEAHGNAQFLLALLSADERLVIELLLSSEGHTTQAEISKSTGMSRLRAHRVVEKMLAKKIITVERIGKTRMLWLAKSIYEALKVGKQTNK